ncbi:MAG: clan AA aspartic protease [Proteobacteria bacterium]|nr:clan AA aspartic protease [Pseudomonadota bacterium]
MSASRGAALILLLWSAGRTVVAAEPPQAQGVETLKPEPLYTAPTQLDRSGRIIAKVDVNGSGPFRFIIDTGANRSAVSPRLVARLGLEPSLPGLMLQTHGVTGEAPLPAVDVDAIRAGDLVYDPGPLPVLAGLVLGDTDGILGTEGLAGARSKSTSPAIASAPRARTAPAQPMAITSWPRAITAACCWWKARPGASRSARSSTPGPSARSVTRCCATR